MDLPAPDRDYKPEGVHAALWSFGDGITLAPDLMPGEYSPGTERRNNPGTNSAGGQVR